MASLKSRITGLTGSADGWRYSSCEDVYQRLATKMTAKGFTDDEAFDLLSDAHWAAVNEYGI